MTRVLIVDEDPIIRVVVGALFSEEGYFVDTAGDGIQALQQVRAAAPDAIVLDLMLPRMDGASFLDACHAQGLCQGTPVVVFSSTRAAPKATLSRLKRRGVRAVLAKPSDIVSVTEVVKQLAPAIV